MRAAKWAALAAVLTMSGCAQETENGAIARGETGQDAAVRVSPARVSDGAGLSGTSAPDPAELNLGAVMDQVHFAYRPKGAGFTASHSTYEVQASNGAVAITPLHHPRGANALPSKTDRARAPGRRGHEPDQQEAPALRGTPIVLKTNLIMRGPRILAQQSQASQVAVAQDGALEIRRETTLERFKNGEGGVEQSWRFETEPAGIGDLTVRVRVDGQRFVGESDQGLHFKGAKNALGFRYGHATWVDAQGRKTSVMSRWEEGQIALRVPSAVVQGSAYPVVLDPIVGPEVGMDAPVLGPASFYQGRPDVSWNGTQWIVVWEDGRNSTTDIYGARVSAGGAVLDPSGIAISTAAGSQSDPKASWSGTHWMIVWEDGRDASGNIYATRVTSGGTVLEPDGIPLCSAAGEQFAPTVAWGTDHWLVVWQDRRGGASSDVYGTLVDANGGAVDQNGKALFSTAEDEKEPSVAWGGTQWLVAFQRAPLSQGGAGDQDFFGDIYASRISADATVLDQGGIAVSTADRGQWSPSVAWNGSQWLIVWIDARNEYPSCSGCSSQVYGARINANGTVADSAGIAITSADGSAGRLHVSPGGAQWLVNWYDYDDSKVYGARLLASGTLGDATTVVLSDSAWDARSAWDGSRWLVANSEGNFTFVSAAGVASDAGIGLSSLSKSVNDQVYPDIAWGGSAWLVVWADSRRAGGSDIYAARIDGSGALLDPLGIEASMASGSQSLPKVAWSGSQWLVVWADDRNANTDIYGTRIASDGTVIDSGAGLSLASASMDQRAPKISSNGTHWLVIWEDFTGSSSELNGVRVGANGILVDASPIALSAITGGQYDASIAWNGSHWLVVWSSSNRTYGVRVSGAGAVVDTTALEATITSSAYGSGTAVSWNGAHWLVVWCDKKPADLVGRRMNADGSFADGQAVKLTTSSTHEGDPSLSWNGHQWLVAYRNWDSDDVLGLTVDASLVPASSPFLISADSSNPAVASNDDRSWMVAYSRFDSAPAFRADRVRARLVKPGDGTCDGFDDDGDGPKDEDYLPTPVSCGIGACRADGMTGCIDGVETSNCTPGVAAASDTSCDGVDDDCSGTADEDYAQAATTCGSGVCKANGHSACSNGSVINVCVAGTATAATDTTCNNTDEDCSGTADEDFVQTPSTCGMGVCAASGMTSCVNGIASNTCIPKAPTLSSDTTCNDVDEDCSGTADEDFAPSTTVCGLGACASSGATSCAAGSVFDSCVAGSPLSPTDATCDGVDDDCSGTADEDATCAPSGGTTGGSSSGSGSSDSGSTSDSATSGGTTATSGGASTTGTTGATMPGTSGGGAGETTGETTAGSMGSDGSVTGGNSGAEESTNGGSDGETKDSAGTCTIQVGPSSATGAGGFGVFVAFFGVLAARRRARRSLP